MARIYYENLAPEIKKNIKNRAYSLEQLAQIEEKVNDNRATRKKGWIRAAITIVVVVVVLLAMTIMSMLRMPDVDITLILFISALMVLLCVLVMVIAWFLGVERVSNQFKRVVKRYYPEYSSKKEM